MADMLNTALSAITSYQRALATTSHNIANANTAGYSRQSVSLNSAMPQTFGFGAIGSGVTVSGIGRSYDEFVVEQMRSSSTSYNQFQTYNDLSSQLDRLFSDANSGVSASLTSFFDSLQQLADDPASLPARQLLLAESNTLASRLGSVDQQLQRIDEEINTRITMAVEDVNGLTSRIADLNRSIRDFTARSGGQPPNDLLDQRDQALFELSSYVNINVVRQDGNTINVFAGSGDALVLGERRFDLTVERNAYNPSRLEVGIESASGTIAISERLSGGSLGGALGFRDDVLDPTRSQLGQLTYGLADSINRQHRAGMDLTGALGADLFGLSSPVAQSSVDNSGSATVAIAIDDVGQLTGSDYRLDYNGSVYQLYDRNSGQLLPMTGSGTVVDPFIGGGIAITVTGASAAGDSYLLQPTARMAGNLEVLITNPANIAAAAATRGQGDIANAGSAVVSASEVVDPDHPLLLTTSTLEFLSESTYQINGSGVFNYISGQPIDINGSRLTLEGTPAAGDRFTLQANSGGSGDNRNALALARLQDAGLFNGANTSLMASASAMLSNVAVVTRTSAINATSQQSLLEQNVARRESISGVNLEEEAANMLRYQQAFQAAAQAVSTSNTIFQTMLNAFSR